MLPLPEQRDHWFTRPTRDHFARQVANLDELDPPRRDALQKALLPGETLRRMIDAPYQALLPKGLLPKGLLTKGLRSKGPGLAKRGLPIHLLPVPLPWVFTPDWLLALTGQRLLLVQTSRQGRAPQVTAIPLGDIFYLRAGMILLFAWLEVHWVEAGHLRQETIYYNTVCESMFTCLCAMIRRDPIGFQTAPASRGLESLDALPYKFMNLIPLRLLLPEEAVCQVLYRPAMWGPYLKFFHRMTAPRMTLVRTQYELLLAEEDPSGEEGSYGLVTTFLPLTRVRGLSYRPENDHLLLEVSLALPGARQEIQIPYPLDREADLRGFIQ